MNKQRRKPEENRNGAALTAVAFQDHLVNSLNLNLSLANPLKSQASLNKKLTYRKPKGKAVVDTNRHQSKTASSSDAPKEYVLDRKPPPPTLAQRLGLIEQPAQLLDETEWKEVKNKATERDEFSQPCVICKEDIGKMCHVILSCTHVFHKNCLQAFERFCGKKSCPMCRKEQYQTRVIYDGSASYRHKCAARIQALWRGYVVRCWYRKLRETVPPKDSKLRTKFYEDKLHTITERMVRSLDMGVNTLLHEVDKNLEASRNVFQQFDNYHRTITPQQWFEIHRKALARRSPDCPICLGDLDDGGREAILTSCSHMFHETCLTTFECLTQLSPGTNSCPVCRSAYQSQLLPKDCPAVHVTGGDAFSYVT